MVKKYVRILEIVDSRVGERDYVKSRSGYKEVEVGLYSSKNMWLGSEVCRWFSVWKYEVVEGEVRMYSKESYEKGELIGRIWDVDGIKVMRFEKRLGDDE